MHPVLLPKLASLVSQYGYAVLFPVAVVEGPGAAIVSGALVGSGQLDGLTVVLMLVAADLVGDALYYALGRWGHTPLLERIGARLKITKERLGPLERHFRQHELKLIMIGKTQALGSVILYFAGAVKMSFTRFMLYNLVGTAPKILLFVSIGFFVGQTIIHSAKSVDYITFVTFGIALILLVSYWLARRYLKRQLDQEIAD